MIEWMMRFRNGAGILMFVSFMLMMPTQSTAQTLMNKDKSITATGLHKFGKVIRLFGFNCPKAIEGEYIEEDHYGHVFKIVCTGYIPFRVTMRLDDTFIVQPW